MVQKGAGQKKEDAQFEMHRKYIDIQLVLDGTDEMGWKPASSLKHHDTEFDRESDLQLFSDEPDIWLPVNPGFFVIFFPEDAHMPMVSNGLLHKIVVKVAENY